MPTTPRLLLPYPLGSDQPDVPQDMQDLSDRLDAILMDFAQGTLAARPAAGATTAPRWYWATDVAKAYYTDGTQWREIINSTDTRLSDQRTPLAGSVVPSKIGAGAGHALGPLTKVALQHGANGGANSNPNLLNPVGFTMPYVGSIKAVMRILLRETGATGSTNASVNGNVQIDGGAWTGSDEGSYLFAVTAADDEYYFCEWTFTFAGLAAGAHTVAARFQIGNNPVIMTVMGPGSLVVEAV